MLFILLYFLVIMKLPIAYFGHPILRKKAAPIEHIDDSIRQLVQDMIETMNANDGCGLAAPQVHHSLALFITQVPKYLPDNTYIPGELRIFINPKILAYSEESTIDQEGCISIPGVRGRFARPCKITVEATNLEGERFEQEFEDYEARAVMHENDHLNGVLFIDRLPPKEKKDLEKFLREIKKKYS